MSFGNVNLNAPATQTLTLSSTGAASVAVSAATVLGTGFSLSAATFPLTIASGQTAALTVQFDPTTAGATTGSLTIVSTSLTNPTTVVSLSGTGVAPDYEVNLAWDAPGSSTDPVAGYNVYRAPSGSASYQQLNASVVATTSYTDNTAQAGETYDYEVESVDAEGVTSQPSNMASVVVP
jgi:hypothetical protein